MDQILNETEFSRDMKECLTDYFDDESCPDTLNKSLDELVDIAYLYYDEHVIDNEGNYDEDAFAGAMTEAINYNNR